MKNKKFESALEDDVLYGVPQECFALIITEPYVYMNIVNAITRLEVEIVSKDLDAPEANNLYNWLRVLLETHRAQHGPNHESIPHIERALEAVERAAVYHLLSRLEIVFDDMHFAEIKRECSAKIREIGTWHWEQYLKKAYEECKCQTEARIEEAKIEFEDKKAMGYFDATVGSNEGASVAADEPGDPTELKAKKHLDLTIDRAILFIRTVIPELDALETDGEGVQSRIADVLDFLTPFKKSAIRARACEIIKKEDTNPHIYRKDQNVVASFLARARRG